MGRAILRASWHDYRSRCIYMITLNKAPGVKEFGMLYGNAEIPRGHSGAPFVSASYVGAAIKEVLRNFSVIASGVRVLQYALMPDHLHFILFVETPTEDTLSAIIARFKAAVNSRLGTTGVFAKGFNDQILKTTRSLDTLYNYLRDNPCRLAVRRAHPDFFRRISRVVVAGMTFEAYGNLQLLVNPFKEAVAVHRADPPTVRHRNRESWLYTAANGGVLVSPFISPAEKEIRREAEVLGGRFILFTTRSFGERYKPHSHDFGLCNEGRLLIISAAAAHCARNGDVSLSRADCLRLNRLATALCN